MEYLFSFLLIAIVVAPVLLYNFPLVRVHDISMFPTYKDGQWLLSRRLKYGGHISDTIEIGKVYVFLDPHPAYDGKMLIKRCVGFDTVSGTFIFMGDNREHSRDSRDFGGIDIQNIVAEVLFSKKEIDCYE